MPWHGEIGGGGSGGGGGGGVGLVNRLPDPRPGRIVYVKEDYFADKFRDYAAQDFDLNFLYDESQGGYLNPRFSSPSAGDLNTIGVVILIVDATRISLGILRTSYTELGSPDSLVFTISGVTHLLTVDSGTVALLGGTV